MLAIPKIAFSKPGKMTVANLREVWQLEETPPLRKVNLGDLAHDWKERTQDNDNQKLTSLFRYILKNVTAPSNSIQK
ncbi:hypothetical protein Y032_0018g3650 [Ancylostoma ceylanicum]|uniref:Uncharacterized protein n=1 Tax=Ancylostoma ceylanicum TaxID=53326 RepID=A0A016V4R9_9BILA|nr:hypothetical protein Y032_0018g3650 [Ancylostoma ceylanicum]